METIKNIKWKSNKVKLALCFFVPFVIVFFLSPGVFFEVESNGIKKDSKIKKSSAAIHSLIISVLIVLFYYFYLSKQPVKMIPKVSSHFQNY